MDAARATDLPAAPFDGRREPVVLVIEDDEKLAGLIARVLRRAGYAAVPATSGDDALREMRDNPPHAVVVDVMIPHPDGIEVCRKFRRDGWRGPLVAMSARNSPDDRRRALAAGADAFLAKPFHLTELVPLIERLQVDAWTAPPGA